MVALHRLLLSMSQTPSTHFRPLTEWMKHIRLYLFYSLAIRTVDFAEPIKVANTSHDYLRNYPLSHSGYQK
jgi:hypothetical protein